MRPTRQPAPAQRGPGPRRDLSITMTLEVTLLIDNTQQEMNKLQGVKEVAAFEP